MARSCGDGADVAPASGDVSANWWSCCVMLSTAAAAAAEEEAAVVTGAGVFLCGSGCAGTMLVAADILGFVFCDFSDAQRETGRIFRGKCKGR